MPRSSPITQAIKQADVKEDLDAMYGEGNWGLDELEAHVGQEKDPTAVETKPPPPKRKPVLGKGEGLETAAPAEEEKGLTFEEVWAKYLAIYEAPTPQDEALLRMLCHLEIEQDRMQRKRDSPASQAQGVKGHLDTLKKLTDMHQAIQKTLGIDRATRSKESTGEIDKVVEVTDRAGELLRKRGVFIVCPHCAEEPAEVKINQGLIVFHFRDEVRWKWESTCPRCGQEIALEGKHGIQGFSD